MEKKEFKDLVIINEANLIKNKYCLCVYPILAKYAKPPFICMTCTEPVHVT